MQFEFVGVREVRGVDVRTINASDGGHRAECAVFEDAEDASAYSALGDALGHNPFAPHVTRANVH